MFNFEENGRYIILALLAVAMILPWFLSQSRAAQDLRWIEVAELSAQLKGKNNLTVVDVRTPDEFTGPLGHIAKATNIPLDQLPARLPELTANKEKPIILVCRSDRRASSAAVLLRDAGMSNVSVLRGGMMQWSQQAK